jgi:limonene-1,2-epoxide hydrolase
MMKRARQVKPDTVGQTNPIDAVHAFIAAINRADLSALSKLMTADHAFIDPAGNFHAGREAMMAGWREYFRMFPDYRIEVESAGQIGPLVALFGKASGTYHGPRGPRPENRIEMPAAWKAIVQGGKIKLWQVYADWTEGTRIMERENKAG